jgi:two-component system nitrogen regulation sensor histidine kinase GlnL
MKKKLVLVGNEADPSHLPDLENGVILNALVSPVLVLDEHDVVQQVNGAAEDLFELSAPHLKGHPLDSLLPADSPLFSLIHQSRQAGAPSVEYGLVLDSPRVGHRIMDAQVSPLPERLGWTVLALHEQSVAVKMGHQLSHRNSARSVAAMAAMMAHEVKNPLSGIRGAAQLLEQNCSPEDKELAQLIRDESDRICALVNRMDIFSEQLPLEPAAVNIHSVLEHVRRIASAGFASHVRFVENYDPSLPRVLGNRDQLVQVFLNLVKNAAEAVAQEGGEIILGTAFQHGIRLAVPGSDSRVHLPLVISVQDNGPGIPADLHEHLFDPFVTTKSNGSGLGLALVAKIVGDHGGVVEFDSQPRRTVFRVMLPMAPKSNMEDEAE